MKGGIAVARQYEYEGRTVNGESIPFTSNGEQWNMYVLEDGTKLKIKTVLMDVIRLDAFSPAGDPVYQCVAQQVIGIDANPALKKSSE